MPSVDAHEAAVVLFSVDRATSVGYEANDDVQGVPLAAWAASLGRPALSKLLMSVQRVQLAEWRGAYGQGLLHELVEADCTASVKEWLRLRGPEEVTKRDSMGRGPMHVARSAAMVEVLAGARAKLSYDELGEMPTHAMARRGDGEAFLLLARRYPGVTKQAPRGRPSCTLDMIVASLVDCLNNGEHSRVLPLVKCGSLLLDEGAEARRQLRPAVAALGRALDRVELPQRYALECLLTRLSLAIGGKGKTRYCRGGEIPARVPSPYYHAGYLDDGDVY